MPTRPISELYGVQIQAYSAELLSIDGLALTTNALKGLRVNAGETGYEFASFAAAAHTHPFTDVNNIGTGTVLYRKTAGTGAAETQTLATLKTDLGLTGTNSGDQTITLTGNVTGSGTGSFATTIAAGAVTLAMQADMATASLVYRKTAGAGAPEVQTLATLKTDLGLTGTNSGDQTITLTGNVTGSGTGSFATTIAAGVVTLAMQANMATASVVYRKTAGSGAPEVQTLATLKTDLGLTGTNSGDQTITLTGDVTGSGTGSFAASIAADAVTYGKLQNASVGNVVLTRAAGTAGDYGETALAASQLLGRGATGDIAAIVLGTNLSMSGTTLNAAGGGGSPPTGTGFRHITAGAEDAAAKLVDTADINDAQVTFAKMANIGTDTLIGRDTAASGVPEAISVGGGIEFTGGGALQTSAFTGDVTKAAGGTATTIPANQITNAMLRDSAGFSVIGKTATGAGDPADIVAGDETVLGRTAAGNLTFAALATGQIAANAVTFAKMQDIATDRLIGRDTAVTGDPEEITVGGGIEFTGAGGIQTSALTGDVTKTAGGTATTIANDAVTYAKFQNAAAANVVLCNPSASAAVDYTELALGASTLLGRGATGNIAACTLGATLSFSAAVLSVASVPTSVTFNNAGSGDASGTTFNGATTRTISYNTLGAAPLASPTFTGTPAAPTATTGTNTTQLATTAFVQQELAANAVQHIWVPASAMKPRVSNPPAVGSTETTTNKVNFDTLDFDGTADEFAQFDWLMPKRWNEGTITAQFAWAAPGGTGNVVWAIQAIALSDDDVLDTAFGTAQTVTDGVTATTDLMKSAATAAMTVAGTPADGDLVKFQVYRDADNASDTLNAIDAKLIGVLLIITTNLKDDS